MSALDSKSPIPLHMQLESILRSNIEGYVWQENELIPSENELSKEYGLSRMTVRSVLTRLVQEGLLYRVPGKGTFVSVRKIISQPLSKMGIREQLERMGYENTTRLIHAMEVPAMSSIAKKLQISEGEPVYEIKRVRYIKDIPLSFHSSYIPKDCCPDLLVKGYDYEQCQLCDILKEDYGVEQDKMVETLEIVQAKTGDAQILDVKRNYPLIHLENIVYARDDRPMEYSSVLFRGDKIKIEISNTYSN